MTQKHLKNNHIYWTDLTLCISFPNSFVRNQMLRNSTKCCYLWETIFNTFCHKIQIFLFVPFLCALPFEKIFKITEICRYFWNNFRLNQYFSEIYHQWCTKFVIQCFLQSFPVFFFIKSSVWLVWRFHLFLAFISSYYMICKCLINPNITITKC